MRAILLIVVWSILLALAAKPGLQQLSDMDRSRADEETREYVATKLPGVIYNDASIYFPKHEPVIDANNDGM
tara:strand:- start:3081 stop:3296 length:216 start_codon:yes stop_codon:yes gene_type:complete